MWVEEGCEQILLEVPPYGLGGVVMVIRLSDASDYFSDDLFPHPGSVASRQILPTFLPTNARVVTTKTMTDNTTKSRKGAYWLYRLNNQTNHLITQNRVGCGELTAMVTVSKLMLPK